MSGVNFNQDMSSDPELFYAISNDNVVRILTFIGGYVDTVGYVLLFGLFTSSITGNLIVATTSMFEESHDVFARLFVTLFFFVGAFFTTSISLQLKDIWKTSDWDVGLISLAQEVAVMIAVTALGVGLESLPEGVPTINSWQCLVLASVMAFSMGVHCATALELIKNCQNTTAMTANIVRTSMSAAKVLHSAAHIGKKPDAAEETVKLRAKFLELFVIVVIFVIGAACGAIASLRIGYWSMLVPVALLLGVMLCLYLGKLRAERERKKEEITTTRNSEDSAIEIPPEQHAVPPEALASV